MILLPDNTEREDLALVLEVPLESVRLAVCGTHSSQYEVRDPNGFEVFQGETHPRWVTFKTYWKLGGAK